MIIKMSSKNVAIILSCTGLPADQLITSKTLYL